MSNIGYFVEIEVLKSEIIKLNCKIKEEREEFMDIYQRMKRDADISNNIIIELRKNYEKMLNKINMYNIVLDDIPEEEKIEKIEEI